MKTSNAKPSKYPHRKNIANGIAICDTKRVQSQSLQDILKNVIKNPE